MKQNNKRIIKYLIYSNILILGIITAGVFLFNDKKLIDSLLIPHSIVNIFIIYISIFLPVSAGSVFFCFSILQKKANSNRELLTIFIFFTLTILFFRCLHYISFLILYLNPLLIEKKIWIENLSETAGYYQSEIFKNKSTDIEKAYIFSSLYLYIDPDSKTINKIHDDIYIELLAKRKQYNKTC